MLESLLVGLGRAVVARAAGLLLSDRITDRERSADLSALVRRRSSDAVTRRTLQSQLEAIADDVARRLVPLCAVEFRDLPEGDKRAALDAIRRTFDTADLSDQSILELDADPPRFTAYMREVSAAPLAGAGLGDVGIRFYDLVLTECCRHFLAVVVSLKPFGPRASVETLRRLSTLDANVSKVLARLPSAESPPQHGPDADEEYLRLYLGRASADLDMLEMPGLTTRHYRPRTTLSVAYLNLSVTIDQSPESSSFTNSKRHDERESWVARQMAVGADRDDGATVRVATALSRSNRILVLGAPGSGKTTLLHWLAVTCARRQFSGDLSNWNGSVPFLVTLRRYATDPLPAPERLPYEAAEMISGLMPSGWAHRQLATGRALLLIDGVDEVSEARRPKVRAWLQKVVRGFPDARVVVTARPTAAGRDWLKDLGFSSSVIEKMTPGDVRLFIDRWHGAIADAAGATDTLPCPPDELPQYSGRLLAELEVRPHLRSLAANPLLCALLCALNLDRSSHMPRDRMSLYEAALDMLLERRDLEREIPSTLGVSLDARDKATLLRGLAWVASVERRRRRSVSQCLPAPSKFGNSCTRLIPT